MLTGDKCAAGDDEEEKRELRVVVWREAGARVGAEQGGARVVPGKGAGSRRPDDAAAAG